MTASDLEITRTAHLWSAARRRRNRPQAVGNSVHRKRLPSRSDDLPQENLHQFAHHVHDQYLFGLSDDLLPDRLTAPQTATAFGGAVTRISISRPLQPVPVKWPHPDGA